MDSQIDTTVVALATPESPPPADPSPGRRVSRRRRPFVLAGLGLLVIVLATGAVLANASLAQAYSGRQAVLDYFGAISRRDADGMVANATFLRGEGSYSYFFDTAAVQGMLKLPANSDIRNVRITSDRAIDGSSRAITVSMSWGGKDRSETLTVRKDPARVHWLFYPSWKVEIPSTQIHIKLPNQAGIVSLDGIPGSSDNRTAIQAIQGFHRVTMAGTTLLDSASQDVDAVDSPAIVTLAGTIRASALEAAKQAVKDGFNSCDATKYDGCFNHTYTAPDRNFIYYFTLPGYGNVSYTKYVNSLSNDPTAGMTLTIQADSGKLSVSGTCSATVTVDGSRHYSLKGDYTGTLTWAGAGFDSDLSWDCQKTRA